MRPFQNEAYAHLLLSHIGRICHDAVIGEDGPGDHDVAQLEARILAWRVRTAPQAMRSNALSYLKQNHMRYDAEAAATYRRELYLLLREVPSDRSLAPGCQRSYHLT